MADLKFYFFIIAYWSIYSSFQRIACLPEVFPYGVDFLICQAVLEILALSNPVPSHTTL